MDSHGHFNIVCSPSEKLGGNPTWHPYSDDLNNCCYESNLYDLHYVGQLFTLSKKSPRDNHIARKLNASWGSFFNGSSMTFLPPRVSDHCPILISIGIDIHIKKTPFKFFNYWTDHQDFESLEASAWSTPIDGFPLFQICQKLKLVKDKLKNLNRTHFGDIQTQVRKAKATLLDILQRLISSPQDTNLRRQESEALHNYISISKAEESFFWKKSRV